MKKSFVLAMLLTGLFAQSASAAIIATGKVTNLIVKNGGFQVTLDTANDSACTSKYRWDAVKGTGAGELDASDWEMMFSGLMTAYYAGQTVQLRSNSDVCQAGGYAAGLEWGYVISQ